MLVRGQPASVWVYNYGPQPLSFRWRVLSGSDTVCGTDAKTGEARRDCTTPDKLPKASVEAARGDAILFRAPDWWFSGWGRFQDSLLHRDPPARDADIELYFGDDSAAAHDAGPGEAVTRVQDDRSRYVGRIWAGEGLTCGQLSG